MGYQMVPVPEDRLGEVFALLGTPPLTSESGMTREPNGAASWARDAILRMFKESPPAMKAFLTYLAEHPGQEFTATEMAESIDRTGPQLAGVLGAFGRRCKNRYRWTRWPFDARWNPDRRATTYEMSPAVAEFILMAQK